MRKLTLLLLVLGLLAAGSIASAQETVPVPCGNLAEADCAILQQSQDAMSALTGADFNLSVAFSLANLPEAAMPEPLAVMISGSGAFAGDLSAMHKMPPADLLSSPQAYTDYVSGILSDFNAEMNLNVMLPKSLTGLMGANVPSEIPLEMKLVDGKGYINFDSLSEALGGSKKSGLPTGWGGIDIKAALATAIAQSKAFGTMNPTVMSSEIMNPDFYNKYVTVERLADDTVDGESVAVFSTSVDLAAMMTDPVMQDLLKTSIENSMSAQGVKMTDAQLAQFTKMYEGMNLVQIKKIGLSDHLLRQSDIEMTWDMTQLMSFAMSTAAAYGTPEATAEATAAPAPVMSMSITFGLSNFNGGQTITAPENAMMFPLPSMTAEPMMTPEATPAS